MLEAFQARKRGVVAALSELARTARALGAPGVAERTEHEIIEKLSADRFHLVVVGEFNHGKTTFVNALLGSAVLPTGITPTTAVIHHLVYADAPGATLVRASGAEESIEFGAMRSFAAGGSEPVEGVRYLEIRYPAELLRERVVLVDTPGVNDLSLTRAEITFGYIPRSDAVLFVLDAGQPLKESERQFLEHKLIGKSRDKIVFVVAKADIWSPEERVEALAYIRERLGRLVPEPVIFAVSAQAALSGRPEESGLPELVSHLNRFLAEERGRIMLGNALGEGQNRASILARGLDARRRAATMSSEELGRRIELLERDLAGHGDTFEKRRMLIREEASAIKAWARRDVDRFCDDVVAQLPGMLEKATGEDVRQHLGAFLEQAFRGWAEAETREIATALEQLAERVRALVRDDAHDVGKRVSEAMGTDLQTPSIEVDTFAYDVGVFAMLSLGVGVLFANALLGGVLIALAPALALYNRDRAEVMIRKRALEVAPIVLRDAAAKVAPKIDEMVEEFAERLSAWVLAASQELHREVIEVLQSLHAARRHESASAAEELRACDALAERLSAVQATLAELRAAV